MPKSDSESLDLGGKTWLPALFYLYGLRRVQGLLASDTSPVRWVWQCSVPGAWATGTHVLIQPSLCRSESSPRAGHGNAVSEAASEPVSLMVLTGREVS